ncbi:uncharacterized protein LOC123537759 [Mercenaria mercenaria]|uniref:uncharacterized protein LOC123537759 n=1 Tax=Mercenaria mercenaria TaxID=6596 RepID=UPI00234EDECD|nr:uncharacterized protein LOC123537759 [Mercenaria mercenaria]
MGLFPKSLHYFVLACVLIGVSYHFVTIGVHMFDKHNYNNNLKEVMEQLKGINGLKQITKNGDNDIRCESCSQTVPNVIVQYGTKRTASTLQFQILCLMMAFLHEDEKDKVGCFFNNKTVNKYTVIKTHNIVRLPISIPSNSWIFVTSSDALPLREKLVFNWSIRKIKERNITIPYVADVDLVSKRGHYIAYEYQTLFGMSDENMQYIIEYLRYWDILRICCGRQMSNDWRSRLLSNANHSQHHNRHILTYPACEMYNISQVELLLLNTYAVQKFGHIASLRDVIGKPSIIDGKLDGGYCERCNKNIIRRRLKFNYKCH